MNEAYFQGALSQLEERILQMIERIPSNAAEMELLEQRCRSDLSVQIDLCRELRTSPIYANPAVQAERLDMYRGLVEELDLIEALAVAVLVRANDDDLRLNLLLKEIVREIGFPLTRPVVSCSSQNYFHIYPHLNLVFVPLMESRQLLHLPDLYHELCHAILAERNDRRVDPFKNALRDTKARMSGELMTLKSTFGLNKTPNRLTDQLPLWTYCWSNNWGVEFFCDLFGVFAVGPAFVWAHVHLCAKHRTLLYSLPQIDQLSHPADAARLEVMLEGLRLSGFNDEVTRLQSAWSELLRVTREAPSDEFQLCYPPDVLRWMAEIGQTAYTKMGCRTFVPGSSARVASLLSEAWVRFWCDVKGYPEWENAAAKRLFQSQVALAHR
jgi:hypothetical protein